MQIWEGYPDTNRTHMQRQAVACRARACREAPHGGGGGNHGTGSYHPGGIKCEDTYISIDMYAISDQLHGQILHTCIYKCPGACEPVRYCIYVYISVCVSVCVCACVCVCASVCVYSARRLRIAYSKGLATTVSKETYYSVKRDLLQCRVQQRSRAASRPPRARDRKHIQSSIENTFQAPTVCSRGCARNRGSQELAARQPGTRRGGG